MQEKTEREKRTFKRREGKTEEKIEWRSNEREGEKRCKREIMKDVGGYARGQKVDKCERKKER